MNPEPAHRARRAAAAVPACAILLLLMGADAPAPSCASIEDAAARLACYDAQAQATPPAPEAEAEAAASPEAPAVALPPAPEPSRAEWEEDTFGKPQGGVDTMASSIVGKFTEWGPGTPVRLANGQQWSVVEDRRYYYPNVPENADVVIKRGMFGYSMEIKALGRRIKVRRIY